MQMCNRSTNPWPWALPAALTLCIAPAVVKYHINASTSDHTRTQHQHDAAGGAVPEARRDGWCDKGRVRDMRPAACTAGTQLYPRPVPAMPASQRLGEHRPSDERSPTRWNKENLNSRLSAPTPITHHPSLRTTDELHQPANLQTDRSEGTRRRQEKHQRETIRYEDLER